MTLIKFFRNDSREEPSFFDEGPPVLNVKHVSLDNTSSIDTTTIDPHRQGVELTQQKHFDSGLAKIHAGEPGHILRRNRYGMDKNFRQNTIFQELDYFSPETFLRAQETATIFDDIVTYPIVVGDNDQLENYSTDGIIEPFTLRARISFFSIDTPFEPHEVKGAVMAGNLDMTHASDLVQTVYVNEQRDQIPYLDQYADAVAFEGSEGSSITEQHVPTIIGIFQNEKSSLSPFVDARYPRNVQISTNYDSTMDAALSLMTGSSENYINQIFKERSAATGWYYDNHIAVGVDSLAFGGMIY